MVNKGLSSILDALFPHYCTLCGLRSYRDVALCEACEGDLWVNFDNCSRCALPLPSLPPKVTGTPPILCGQCLLTPPPFDRVIAPWIYDEQMAYLLHRWKFQGDRLLTPLLAYLWLSHLPPNYSPPDIIVPVPLHWRKLWTRGFNQSALFSMEIQRQHPELSEAKFAARTVQRHRATLSQSELNAAQRQANIRGAFTARQRCDNLRVAIVDDVMTTGATAAAMATTLRDAGASHIEIWCLARTPQEYDL